MLPARAAAALLAATAAAGQTPSVACTAELQQLCGVAQGNPSLCASCVVRNVAALRGAGCSIVLGTHDDSYDWCHTKPSPTPPSPTPPSPPAPPTPPTPPEGDSVTLRNGVKMPLVAVAAGGASHPGGGTPGKMFLSRADVAEVNRTVASALSQGYTSIDTAYDYQCCGEGQKQYCGTGGEACESGVAQAMAGYDRSKLFVTTKVPGCGVASEGMPSAKACYADTLDLADKNLAKLGIAAADLTLLHFPPAAGCASGQGCADAQQQWAALEAVYKAGKARAIGVSNYCRACLECLAKNSSVAPMVNHLQYHIGMGADPAGLHSYCASKGIQVSAYSMFAAGGGPIPSAGEGPDVKAVGAAHGKSSFQTALRWIVQRGIPISVKSEAGPHYADDRDMFGWSLSASEMARLDAVSGPACKNRKWPNAPEKCC